MDYNTVVRIAEKMKHIIDEERDDLQSKRDDVRHARDSRKRDSLREEIADQLKRVQAMHDGFTSLLHQADFPILMGSVGEYPR